MYNPNHINDIVTVMKGRSSLRIAVQRASGCCKEVSIVGEATSRSSYLKLHWKVRYVGCARYCALDSAVPDPLRLLS